MRDTLKSILGNCSCITLLSDIHVTKTILSIQPARMQAVKKMQGWFSIAPSMEIKKTATGM